MATGLSNKLTGQIGEFLACAELGRQGYIATSFTGNVPEYDIIVSSDSLKTLPIQVKTSRSETWPSRADLWLDIEMDHGEKQQINRGLKSITNPDLIYICIALGDKHGEDRFFICRKRDIQDACVKGYTEWMDAKDWKRPRNYQSLDNRYSVKDLVQFEDNWALICQAIEG